MKTKEFIENLVLETGKQLTLTQNPNYPSMGSVYFNGVQVCSVPFNEIFEEHRDGYSNELGYPHRNIPTAKAIILSFIEKFETDEEFKSLMTEKI